MLTGDFPVEFAGTEDERRANLASHHFVSNDPEEVARCVDCDSRYLSVSSYWPCGVHVPRRDFSKPETPDEVQLALQQIVAGLE